MTVSSQLCTKCHIREGILACPSCGRKFCRYCANFTQGYCEYCVRQMSLNTSSVRTLK